MSLIRTWMVENVGLFTDPITGEVNESGLAELYCEEHGIDLEPDGNAPDNILNKAYDVAKMQEIKTGARQPKIHPALGDFINHMDSNFMFPKVRND